MIIDRLYNLFKNFEKKFNHKINLYSEKVKPKMYIFRMIGRPMHYIYVWI